MDFDSTEELDKKVEDHETEDENTDEGYFRFDEDID